MPRSSERGASPSNSKVMKRFQSRFLSLLLPAAMAIPAKADSLWTSPGAVERPITADRKACRVGDIITIVVSESATQSSSASKKTSTDSSVDASVSNFLFANSKMGTHLGSLPATKFGGTSAYTGSGSMDNSQSITTQAAVTIIDILPNGNFVIEGVRRIVYSGETQNAVLHGIVRPDDITASNTVASSNIANARLEFTNSGDLEDAKKRGWFSKMYEWVRPF